MQKRHHVIERQIVQEAAIDKPGCDLRRWVGIAGVDFRKPPGSENSRERAAGQQGFHEQGVARLALLRFPTEDVKFTFRDVGRGRQQKFVVVRTKIIEGRGTGIVPVRRFQVGGGENVLCDQQPQRFRAQEFQACPVAFEEIGGVSTEQLRRFSVPLVMDGSDEIQRLEGTDEQEARNTCQHRSRVLVIVSRHLEVEPPEKLVEVLWRDTHVVCPHHEPPDKIREPIRHNQPVKREKGCGQALEREGAIFDREKPGRHRGHDGTHGGTRKQPWLDGGLMQGGEHTDLKDASEDAAAQHERDPGFVGNGQRQVGSAHRNGYL